MSWAIAVVCGIVRVAGALFVKTYFNPDEYWQGPEVAHRVVFGYVTFATRCGTVHLDGNVQVWVPDLGMATVRSHSRVCTSCHLRDLL